MLAILLVETYYRPPFQRVAEYLAWAVLSLLFPRALSDLSVGIAQAKLTWWTDARILSGNALFSPGNLLKVLSPHFNYDVVRHVLSVMPGPSYPAARAAVWYVGGWSTAYSNMFELALRHLREHPRHAI